ncbi:hypothetical protein [Bacillus rhizoplanae]|uniref:hypothetical protein n=1 Tax=Bacillus rhizoplanae TaxID=2880966 RepID=UPI003D25EC01
MEGIVVAKKEGKHLGCPQAEITDVFKAAYKKWKSGEITAVQAMKEADVKKTIWYKLIKQLEGGA